MDVIHRVAIFVDAKLEKVDHWVQATFFNVRIFAEIVVCVEQIAGINSVSAAGSAVVKNDVADVVE